MLVAIKSTFDALLNLINGKADITYVDNAVANAGNGIQPGSRLQKIQDMNLPNGNIIKGGNGTDVTAFDIDAALAGKASTTALGNVNTQITNLTTTVNNKADKTSVYTKTESDGRYYQKSQTYTKTEIDNKINNLTVPSAQYATQAEAQTGTVNNKVMSPLRTKEAIDYQRPYSTKAEAEAGTNNTKMMTPLRVKEAIMALSPPPDLSSYATITYVNTQINARAKKPIILTSVPTNPALYQEGDIIFVIENP